MSSGRLCVRRVVFAEARESAREAALRMTREEVGTLVVLDEARRPVGMLTDRDLVLRCLAPGRDPEATPIAELMSAPVSSVGEATPIEDALERMRMLRVRRLPVVDAQGALVGILALDDVLELLVEEAESIGRLLRRRPPAGA
jgi:CBS domain-containing protein